MTTSNEVETSSGYSLKEYDKYRPLSVEHIRDEMYGQWDHEATDEEVAEVIDYIDENVWMFLYDAIASVLSSSETCTTCDQVQVSQQGEAPHP